MTKPLTSRFFGLRPGIKDQTAKLRAALEASVEVGQPVNFDGGQFVFSEPIVVDGSRNPSSGNYIGGEGFGIVGQGKYIPSALCPWRESVGTQLIYQGKGTAIQVANCPGAVLKDLSLFGFDIGPVFQDHNASDDAISTNSRSGFELIQSRCASVSDVCIAGFGGVGYTQRRCYSAETRNCYFAYNGTGMLGDTDNGSTTTLCGFRCNTLGVQDVTQLRSCIIESNLGSGIRMTVPYLEYLLDSCYWEANNSASLGYADIEGAGTGGAPIVLLHGVNRFFADYSTRPYTTRKIAGAFHTLRLEGVMRLIGMSKKMADFDFAKGSTIHFDSTPNAPQVFSVASTPAKGGWNAMQRGADVGKTITNVAA